MKPNHILTGMLALTTIVVTSCSAPRYAQQSHQADDVYNSNAKAQIYTPQERPQAPAYQDDYDQNDEYYGASDPYYDMDYSSRINRFSYSSPWRSYYDPYFDGYYGYGYGNGFGYNGFSLGFGFGSIWNSPYYGWGGYYSPFWGYNPWGWNSFYGGGFYGGGFYGGGYYGGGYYGGGYYGGGSYTGRTTNVPRPSSGRENGVPSYNRPYGNVSGVRTSRVTRTDANGNVISRGERYTGDRQSRADVYRNGGQAAPTRTSRGDNYNRPQQTRPTRDDGGYRPQPESRPTYSPPARSGNDGGGRSSGGYGGGGYGGGGGGGRSSRGGRG